MLSYTVKANFFSYTRTLQGLELKVCGLELGPHGLGLRLESCGLPVSYTHLTLPTIYSV